MEAPAAKHHHPYPHHDNRERNRYHGLDRWFRPFARDDRRGRQEEIYIVTDKPTAKGTKKHYCEYHNSKTRDTINYSILKREMEEKQLDGNIIEIARSLRAKFDTENPKNNTRGANFHEEVLMVRHKRGRKEHTNGVSSIIEATRDQTFSTSNPSLTSWKGDDPLVIQGSIRDTVIHHVSVDTGS